MQLIRSKIEQPLPAPHLVRGRLVGALQASTWSGLSTFVVGRAGTGKSVVALDLAEAAALPAGWYTIDASDTDFERFTHYLSAVLRLPHGTATGRDPAETVADRLLGALFEQIDAPALLVVENLHLVYDTPWFGPFITRFLPLLPLNVHVLVTTRSLPPVPLWRMRSKQALAVLDEEALAFTDAEAVQLFARYGLAEATARTALRATRGRAARLDALARCLSGHGSLAEGPGLVSSLSLRTG